jgi:uncharacterized membrane protein
MRTAALTLVGIALILVAGRDAMHELFHPEITGSISRLICHHLWRLIRALARGKRSVTLHAGPILLVGVAAAWTILAVFGWAFIYWPRLPHDFAVSPGVPPSATEGFGSALYVSLSSVTTLSAGNLSPTSMVARVSVAIEAFVGPAILTAWVTWVLSIFPVLANRRAFALEVLLLQRTYGTVDRVVHDSPPESVSELLRSLTEQILCISAELRQASVSYYFQSENTDASLMQKLPYLLDLAAEAREHGDAPAVKRHGAMLERATEDFLAYIGDRFLDQHNAPTREIVDALLEDHLIRTS